MTDPALFAKIGEALYGPYWVSSVAQALGVTERRVCYWRSGRPIPEPVWDELYVLAAQRIETLVELYREALSDAAHTLAR
ncbi:MAG: hypothetical protein V4808_16085 [Pseudomonadota bacterium]